MPNVFVKWRTAESHWLLAARVRIATVFAHFAGWLLAKRGEVTIVVYPKQEN